MSNLPPGCGLLPTEEGDWKEPYFDDLIDRLAPVLKLPEHFEALVTIAPALVAAIDQALAAESQDND